MAPDIGAQAKSPTPYDLEINLFGGCVDSTVVKPLYAFKCTALEFREASERLESEMKRHIEALTEHHHQLPIAIENAWVGAMIAVVNGLTLRKGSPDKFDSDYELLVRDGLCTTVSQVVHAVEDNDKFDVFLNRKSDVVIRIRARGSPTQRLVELGNINRLVSHVSALGNGDGPPSTH